jgi:hypothetical protein
MPDLSKLEPWELCFLGAATLGFIGWILLAKERAT